MMMDLYKLKYITKRGETMHASVPAPTPTKAYLEVQMAFPECDVISCEKTGKVICEDGWLDVFADYLIGNATLKDITEFSKRLGSIHMREELVEAIWKRYHNKERR